MFNKDNWRYGWGVTPVKGEIDNAGVQHMLKPCMVDPTRRDRYTKLHEQWPALKGKQLLQCTDGVYSLSMAPEEITNLLHEEMALIRNCAQVGDNKLYRYAKIVDVHGNFRELFWLKSSKKSLYIVAFNGVLLSFYGATERDYEKDLAKELNDAKRDTRHNRLSLPRTVLFELK